MLKYNKLCAVCGPRPDRLPEGLDAGALITAVEHEMTRSVFLGYGTFMSGMSMGTGIWAAECAAKLKEGFKHVRLICFLPCETQADNWPEKWRERYFYALAAADAVICMQGRYSPGCVQRRDREMIKRAGRLIAVCDGKNARSAVAQTLSLARQNGLDTAVINPLELLSNTIPARKHMMGI